VPLPQYQQQQRNLLRLLQQIRRHRRRHPCSRRRRPRPARRRRRPYPRRRRQVTSCPTASVLFITSLLCPGQTRGAPLLWSAPAHTAMVYSLAATLTATCAVSNHRTVHTPSGSTAAPVRHSCRTSVLRVLTIGRIPMCSGHNLGAGAVRRPDQPQRLPGADLPGRLRPGAVPGMVLQVCSKASGVLP
jgi:hypothetical protein